MPITLPDEPSYRTGKWGAISNATRFESPITRSVQSVGRPGDMWRCEMVLPPMEAEEAYTWAGKLVQLLGGRESAYLYPPYRRDLGTPGTPLIKGEGQTGTLLLTDGWTPGYTLKIGSWLHYNTSVLRMLHITTANATADSEGNMSIPIRHAIRWEPTDNAPLELSRPSCAMITDTADADLLDLADALTYGMSMNFREALY